MDDASKSLPTSPWKAAMICCALVLILGIVALAVVRMQLLVQISADDMRVRSSIEKLEKQIEVMESRIATLAEVATPDPAPMDALKTAVDQKDLQIRELTARIETLEKQPMPVAPPQVVAAPPTPVAPPAPDMAAENALRTQLRDILATIPAEDSAEPEGLAARINRNLTGLVSIKKQSAVDVYARLRERAQTARIPALIREIEQMPPAAQTPLADWVDAARAETRGAP